MSTDKDFYQLLSQRASVLNTPGIRGIGDKTAARLLADQAHLENLSTLNRLTGRAGALIRHQ
jgi:DNA polymerase-1